MTATATRVTGLGSLAWRLTRARLTARQGETLLYLASIAAYMVGGALALTVAAGTWMFYWRWQHPSGLIAEVIAEEPSFKVVLTAYFALALVACALLIPALVSLSAGAAVLGARARERRLAVLRLVGLSSGDVTRMSLLDTSLQATIGVTLGAVLYLATVPFWQALKMTGMPLTPAEMLLPWWLGLAVAASVIAIGLCSAWWGLRQVRVSPLGVARRTNRPALRRWRLAAFAVIFMAAFLATQVYPPGRDFAGFIVLAGALLTAISGVNLLGAYVLQTLARPLTLIGSPSVLWAARRVIANPRAAWSRVFGVGLLALIAGFVALMPIEFSDSAKGSTQTFVEASQWDFTKGAIITLSVGLMLSAASILISQASAVFERAEQTIAIHRIGAPIGFLTRTMWLESLGTLAVSVTVGFAAGAAMARPMYGLAAKFDLEPNTTGVLVVGCVLLAGLALSACALIACGPLQRRVLTEQHRAAD